MRHSPSARASLPLTGIRVSRRRHLHLRAHRLFSMLSEVFSSRSLARWRETLDRHEITFGVVAATHEAAQDEQMMAHGLFPALEPDDVQRLLESGALGGPAELTRDRDA